jgi:hypothetical protein
LSGERRAFKASGAACDGVRFANQQDWMSPILALEQLGDSVAFFHFKGMENSQKGDGNPETFA